MTSSRDYSKGKIYKIEPICDHDEGDIYIGSTTKQYLSQRMTKHKSNYLSWRNNPQGKTPKLNSFDLFDKYGLNNCHIILIKNFPCSSKDELYAGEALQIKNVKCVNKHVPFRTEEEKKEITLAYTLQNKAHKKVYDQEYRQKTKDNEDIKERRRSYDKVYRNSEVRKQYNEDYKTKNKEKLQERLHQYYINNKEKKQLYEKERYEKIKEEIQEKIICGCGCELTKGSLTRHKKGKKHINLMNAKLSETTN